MKIQSTTNFDQVAQQLAQLGEAVAERATTTAMNRTMTRAKTAMVRGIRDQYNVRAAEVRQNLRIARSRTATLTEVALEAPPLKGRALNVSHFNARQTKKGVTVSITRGGGRKLIRGAWIGNKGRTVFQRVGKSRLPIKPVQTVSVPQMFNARHIRGRVEQLVRDQFPIEFERAARYYANRLT